MEFSWTKDWTYVPCIGRWILILCATVTESKLIDWEADREDFRLALQNNHLFRACKPSSFMDQRWREVKKQSKKPISVHFTHSIVSDSLRSHGLQHTRLPYPSPTLGLTQTHVQQVSDAIQPSYPLSSPFPPAFSLAQHQGLFQGVSSVHKVTKVLELQLQDKSFQWIFRTDFL